MTLLAGIAVPQLSLEERAELGRRARATASRSSHADWQRDGRGTDPIRILEEQEEARVPELLPIRHGRMAASPFAFYRGAAAVMAADLAGCPATGLQVQLCGDAHLLNFGVFADPARELVFDINDFDETLPGPFEWDVKRLAASIEVATRQRGFARKLRRSLVTGAVAEYRRAMGELAMMSVLGVWYARLDITTLEQRWGRDVSASALRNLRRAKSRAESKDHLKAFKRLTVPSGDGAAFRSDPPLLQPIAELFPGFEGEEIRQLLTRALHTYRRTLPRSTQHLLDRYRPVDMARKVVGVGSVGTRCWVALMLGLHHGDPLFIQIKEAERSVLERHLHKSIYPNQGQRVVEGQRLMQAASDILLGWDRVEAPDGVTRDFYMRQLWDWKGSADIEVMTPEVFDIYTQMCGWTLARAHARSGDPVAIAAYLGQSDAFERAITAFAGAYADQNEKDHASLCEAIRAGSLEAREGL